MYQYDEGKRARRLFLAICILAATLFVTAFAKTYGVS